MSNYKISIILPVYNVEKYLTNCLNSLVNQTFNDIEIIAVNDGSPDNSIQILEKFQTDYPDMVKVYSTENKGVSHARNFGLSKATGEYVMFVDSDDFVELTMCEELYNKAVTDGNDIVICGRFNIKENESKTGYTREANLSLPISQNFKLEDRKFELVKISPFPWDKLFKRELFNNVKFVEGMRFEDLPVQFYLATKAKSIGVVKKPLYNYRVGVGFLNTFTEATFDIIKAFEMLINNIKNDGNFEIYRKELEYLCARHFIYRYKNILDDKDKDTYKLKVDLINQTQEFINSEFPTWSNNHYLKYTLPKSFRDDIDVYTNREAMLKIVRKNISASPNKKNIKLVKKVKKISVRVVKFSKKKDKLKRIKKKLSKTKVYKLTNLPVEFKYTKYFEKLKVQDNVVLFESKHGVDIAGNVFNMLLVTMEPKYQGLKVYVTVKEDMIPRFRNLLDSYKLNHVQIVPYRSNEYLKLLCSAKYLVTDTSFAPYFIKKDEQVYLNTWHGTPLKLMGRKVPERQYSIGNVQRNFLIADYLIYQQDFSKDIFLKDYMIDEIYDGEVVVSGYPRNSAFFREDTAIKIRKELELEGKEIIAYMPTWRGLLHKMDKAAQVKKIYNYLAKIDNKLKENQIFFVRLHPLVGKSINYSEFLNIKPFPENYETYDFLNASDMLVTDYSSIMFDYGVSKKKIILFTYDREEYLNQRGMYADINEFDIPKADTVEELIEEINKPLAPYTNFYNTFCSNDNVNTASEVCDMLFATKNVKDDKKKVKESKPQREKVLVYFKEISKRKDRDDFNKDINEFALTDKKYYLAFQGEKMKKRTTMFEELNNDIYFLPLSGKRNQLLSEYVSNKLKFKGSLNIDLCDKKLDDFYARERKKHFGNTEFDTVVFYSCMNRVTFNILNQFDAKKVFSFKPFSVSKYKKSDKYRKTVEYFMDNIKNFEVVYIPEKMMEITELAQKFKTFKAKVIVIEKGEFSIKKVLEGVK